MAILGFESMISGSEVDLANHYSIGHLFEIWQIHLHIHCVLACPSFGECTASVKLELTDFCGFLSSSL